LDDKFLEKLYLLQEEASSTLKVKREKEKMREKEIN
jgi:hypothetical protein